MIDMKEKVVLVTGGSRGIGFAISKLFAKANAKVVMTDIERLDAAKEEIVSESPNAVVDVYIQDISSSASTTEVVKSVVEKYGKIDILINNAGITKDTLLMRMKDDDWTSVIKTNLDGVFYTTREVIKHMIRAKSGRVINISSVVGITGNAGQANYSAAKGGVIAFTKTTAREVASRGITVNAIAPGFIETDMTKKLSDDIKNKVLSGVPVGRFGKPSEIASMVLFLSSDMASYITGQTMNVDGGMVM